MDCSVDGCGSPHLAKGFCSKHYYRWKRHGDPHFVDIRENKKGQSCLVDGCYEPIVCRDWCSKHYQRWKATGDPLKSAGTLEERKCKAANCDKPISAFGYCQSHARKLRLYDDINGGRKVKYRKNGEGTYNNGYHFTTIWVNGTQRQIGTHRLVMEQKLGRKLRKNENVHHINGVRNDNSPENLELWVRTQPCGQRPQDLVKWAKEILELYESEV